jgi:ABC-type nitrate/sulfonate/bicarbonate transport system substrate-binding protein
MLRAAHRGSRRGALPVALALTAIVIALLPASALAQSGGLRAPLRLGWTLTGGVQQLPMYLAAEGFFAEEGLDVQVVSLSSGSRVMAALAAGSVDVAMSSLDAAVTAIGAGHPIRVFYAPRTAVGFVWYTRPGISGWKDLKGRTVAISSFGSLTDVLTRFALKRHGLSPGVDVNMIQLAESATRMAALRAGRVDAIIVSPPLNYSAEELGLSLLDTQQTAIGELWPQGVFAARERLLAEQPGSLRALLRAYIRGVRRARAERGASVEVMMTQGKFSRAHAERLYAEALPTLDERGDPPPRAMTAFWGMLAASGEISEPWPEARFLDRRFIDTFADWAPPR